MGTRFAGKADHEDEDRAIPNPQQAFFGPRTGSNQAGSKATTARSTHQSRPPSVAQVGLTMVMATKPSNATPATHAPQRPKGEVVEHQEPMLGGR